MDFGSTFLEVMGMNEISNESIKGRGSRPVVQNGGNYAFRVQRRK